MRAASHPWWCSVRCDPVNPAPFVWQAFDTARDLLERSPQARRSDGASPPNYDPGDSRLNMNRCLNHGATSGVLAEPWQAPAKADNRPSSAVLKRAQQDHSKGHLAMTGAEANATIDA